MKLIFVNYWDVWGNENDGWDVNDVSRHKIEGCEPDTEADVLNLLIANDLVHSDVSANDLEIQIDSYGAEIIERANGKPFGRIEWEG